MPSPCHASPRHARTCSGHPCGRAAEAVEVDARNKSGHDGEGRSGMTEGAFGHDGGGAFRHGGKRGDRSRCARPKPPLGFAQWLNRTAVELVLASPFSRLRAAPPAPYCCKNATGLENRRSTDCGRAAGRAGWPRRPISDGCYRKEFGMRKTLPNAGRRIGIMGNCCA